MNNIYIRFLIYFYRFNHPLLRKRIRRIVSKREKGEMWSKSLRFLVKKYHNITVGYGSYGGMFRNVSSFKPGTVIGNYCSFANNIYHFNANHPHSSFTTHPILYEPNLRKIEKERLSRTKLVIGHDVWIGQGVIILPGVEFIGNGAIIGAGSIVTKNVDSYSIVVGNPAKKLRARFSDIQIKKLESSRWWEFEYESLYEHIEEINSLLDTP